MFVVKVYTVNGDVFFNDLWSQIRAQVTQRIISLKFSQIASNTYRRRENKSAQGQNPKGK